MDATLIGSLLKLGAPWVLTAVLLYLFVTERKRKETLTDRLYDLASNTAKAMTEFQSTMKNVEKEVNDLEKRMPR